MRPQYAIDESPGRGLRRAATLLLLALLIWLLLPAISAADDRNPDAYTPTISVASLRDLIRQRTPLLIVDVRSPGEFAVSHIADANNIDPTLPFQEFVAQFGAAATGKVVVIYCTAQPRSADYALGIEDAMLKRGAASVNVLQGGLIGWHNAEAPLVDTGGATDFIHPFDDELIGHLKRPHLARMQAGR